MKVMSLIVLCTSLIQAACTLEPSRGRSAQSTRKPATEETVSDNTVVTSADSASSTTVVATDEVRAPGQPAEEVSATTTSLDAPVAAEMTTSETAAAAKSKLDDTVPATVVAEPVRAPQPAAPAAAAALPDGQIYNVSLAELQATIGAAGNCNGGWSELHSLHCNSASSRWCGARGYAGGVIQEYDGGGFRANVLCLRGRVIPLPLAVLDSYVPTAYCSGGWSMARSLFCESAAARFCAGLNYQGGFIEEYDGGGSRANIICSGTARKNVTLAQLQATIGAAGNCTGGWDTLHSLHCISAASRYCASTGYRGGYFQEYDSGGSAASITCVK